MHAHHIILAKAESKEDAIVNVKEWLEHYGDGKVWDYYSFGGRWSWANGEDELSNVMNISSNKVMAKKLIKGMLESQEQRIESAKESLMHFMKGAKINSFNMLNRGYNRVGYCLHHLGQLIAGYYCFDSHFYDIEYGSAYIDDKRIQEVLEDDKMWILNLDLHN
jgi:hypothetical protein